MKEGREGRKEGMKKGKERGKEKDTERKMEKHPLHFLDGTALGRGSQVLAGGWLARVHPHLSQSSGHATQRLIATPLFLLRV